MKKTGKKIIGFALTAILLVGGVKACEKYTNNKSQKEGNTIASITDTLFDIFSPEPDFEIEDTRTENKIKTDAMIEDETNFDSEMGALNFYNQLSIQSKEDINNNYNSSTAQDIELYDKMAIDFIVRGKPNRGYTYQNLSLSVKGKIIKLAQEIHDIKVISDERIKALAIREQDKKEYEQSLRRVLKDWLGTNK